MNIVQALNQAKTDILNFVTTNLKNKADVDHVHDTFGSYQYGGILPTTGTNGQVFYLKELNQYFGTGITANLSISDSSLAQAGMESWTSSESIKSGESSDGYFYRSKITFSTTGLTIDSSSKLVVKVTVTQQSSPKGCMGVLTTNGDLGGSEVQNSTTSGPSTALSDSAIATSYAYVDEDKTEISGTNLAADSVFYLVFDTNEIAADTTYYLYLIRTTDHYTGTGFTGTTIDNVELTLTYDNGTSSSGRWYKYSTYIYDET